MTKNNPTRFFKTSIRKLLLLMFFISVNAYSQTITYAFANAQNTNDGTDDFYEADIVLTTDTDFALGAGQFYLDYNTAAFGTNIYGSALTFTHPAASATAYVLDERIFGGAISGYSIVNANSTTSKLSISWSTVIAGQVSTNVTAAGSPNLICHIKIKYVDVNESPNISFDTTTSPDPVTSYGLTFTDGGTQIINDSYDSSESNPPVVWTGTSGGDFSSGSNWATNAVPGATSRIMIPSGLTNYPTATGPVTVDEIIIESGASFIAQSTVTANITYKRTLAGSDWYIVSAPVSGIDIDDFVNANNLQESTLNPGNIAFGTYNTATNSWDYYNGDTGSATMTPGIGYTVNLEDPSGTIEFSGGMLTDDLTGISLTTTGAGFNLIGNPYPSYMNSNDLLTLSSNSDALKEQTIWLWDSTAGGGTGAYVAKVAIEGFQIAPGQAFFVQSDGVAGSIDINESFQSHQYTDTFMRSGNARPEIHVSLTDGTNTKETKIFYVEGATTGFDNGFDGSIFGGNADNSFNVYTNEVTPDTGNDLAIQSLPPDNYENMIIPIGVNAQAGTSITFSLETLNLAAEINVYLEDTENNTFTKLNEDSANYEVTLSSASYGSGRFYLHTTASVLSNGGSVQLQGVQIFTNSNKELIVKGLNPTAQGQVSLYNILGQLMLSETIEGGTSTTLLPSNLRAGVYMVKVQTDRGNRDQKILIQ